MRRTVQPIKDSRAFTDMHNLRLMALLQELLRDKGLKGTADALGVDRRTLEGCVQKGRLTNRVRAMLNKGLQYGLGSAAAEQLDRNDRLEARLDKMEGQVRELKGSLRTCRNGLAKLEGRVDRAVVQQRELKDEFRKGLKKLRMTLDGVRKYYGVQRRLIEQRLLVLESGREGTKGDASTDDKRREPRWESITPGALRPREFKTPSLAELLDAEERAGMSVEKDVTCEAGAPAQPDAPK